MKNKLCLLILILIGSFPVRAQDTTKVNVLNKKIVEVSEDSGKTEVSLLNDRINIRDNSGNDTTSIRIGRRNVEIVEGDRRTNVTVHRLDKEDKEWKWRGKKRFNGHWSGFDLGVNGLGNKNYSLYSGTPDEGNEFMELDQPKSLEVNLNFVEYNIVLHNDRIGLVTGMGFSMNNYRFDNDLTIDKGDDGIIHPGLLDEANPEKSKLTVSYLTVPLMLEFQFPVNGRSNKFFVSGGLLGGINLGSHTKVKYDDSKEKDHGSFNINPFKCAAMIRTGLRDISLYASYGLTPLFKDDKGPELFPFSIGISLINL
jgi:hypothetical protein